MTHLKKTRRWPFLLEFIQAEAGHGCQLRPLEPKTRPLVEGWPLEAIRGSKFSPKLTPSF
jgi:hypothetical protein